MFIVDPNKKIKKETVYESMLPKDNYNHPDPLLRIHIRGMLSCNCPFDHESKYMSMPLLKGSYISGDERQKSNLEAFAAALIAGYGQKGGMSALLKAGTGHGKTYYITMELAQMLGEMCNCQVYFTAPVRTQIDQINNKYTTDICYSGREIEEPGENAVVRAYIYDKLSEINSTTRDPLSGAVRANILIIDEGQFIITEKNYRDIMPDVNRKAREFLAMGGIVLVITASTELISIIMPYDNLTSYSLICNMFTVSSDKPLKTNKGELTYPNYRYKDIVKYGEASGVYLVNNIPASKIKILFKDQNDKIKTAVLNVLIDLLNKGKKVLMEYNSKKALSEIQKDLESRGYNCVICSAEDNKNYKYDSGNRIKTYNNSVYNDIIYERGIDFRGVDVVMTTKLLENGTSIDTILGDWNSQEEKDWAKNNINTVYVLNKYTDMNLEAFEQFAGRIRFEYDEAILLTGLPEDRSISGKKKDIDDVIHNEISRVKEFVGMIEDGLITMNRLNYVDYNDIADFRENLTSYSGIDAETLSQAIYYAYRRYYIGLMYDTAALEKEIRSRYHNKTVTIEQMEKAEAKISNEHGRFTEEEKKKLSTALSEAASDPEVRELYIKGISNHKQDHNDVLLPGLKELSDLGRRDLINTMADVCGVTLTLMDLKAKDGAKSPDSEAFSEKVLSALESSKKTELTALFQRSISEGFDYISQFGELYNPLYNYAQKQGTHAYANDAEKLIAQCGALLPSSISPEHKERITDLMRFIFKSKIKMSIDQHLHITGGVGCKDMSYFSQMSLLSTGDIKHLTFLYEMTYFTLHPEVILSDKTASGAFYGAVTSQKVFETVTNKTIPDAYQKSTDIGFWEGTTLSRERVKSIIDATNQILLKYNHKGINADNTTILKVLRVFAACFHITKITPKEDGALYTYRIEKKRTDYPKNYTDLVRLTFSVPHNKD